MFSVLLCEFYQLLGGWFSIIPRGFFFGQIHPRDSGWEFGFQLWQCQVGAAKLISLHINSSFQGKKISGKSNGLDFFSR